MIALAVMIAVPVYLIIRMKNRFRFDVYALTFGLLAYMVGVGIIPTVIELLAAQIAPVKEFFVSKHSCFRHLACHTSDRILASWQYLCAHASLCVTQLQKKYES